MATEERAWRSAPVAAWVVVLTVVVLAPALRPGYVLRGDMVATPQQYLVPDALGVGSAVPRAVPMDAVLAVLTSVVDGAIVQKAFLVAGLLLAGFGAARLVPGGRALAAGAATLMIWNPFVAERLLMGHWALLLAYGAVPWALDAALELRRGHLWAGWRLFLWLTVAGLTPPGAVVMLAVVGPVVFWPGDLAWRKRSSLLVLTGVGANLPWLLPALLHPSMGRSDPSAVDVFAARADSSLGVVGSLVGLGGVWNSDAVPASRAAPTAAILTIGLVIVAVAGFRPLRRAWGRGADGLAAAAALGLLLAAWGAVGPTSLSWAVEHLPGAGMLRDGQRLVVPLGVLIATAAPLGTAQAVQRLRHPEGRRLVAAGLLLVPMLVLPDLAWGLLGRLTPVSYPAGWTQVRDGLASFPDGADVVSLPWQPFRRYPWNDDRPVLDPLPRFVDRVVVTSADLPVRTADGVRTVRGEDQRSARVGALVESGEPLADTMPAEGIGWAVVQDDTPGEVDPALLRGAAVVMRSPPLTLLRLTSPGSPVAGAAPAGYRGVVIAVDAGVGVAAVIAFVCSARRSRLAGTVRSADGRGGHR